MNKEKIKETYHKVLPFTFLSSLGMGILKVMVAIITKSLGLFLSSFYNFFIGIAKMNIFAQKDKSIYKRYSQVGILIIIASVLYINYSMAVIRLHITSNYHMYVAILIAAVTFTDIVLAILGIIRSKKKNNVKTEMLKYLNLSTALISLSLTQTAILSFTNQEDMSYYNGVVGIILGAFVCMIGMYMLVNGTIKLFDEKKSK